MDPFLAEGKDVLNLNEGKQEWFGWWWGVGCVGLPSALEWKQMFGSPGPVQSPDRVRLH